MKRPFCNKDIICYCHENHREQRLQEHNKNHITHRLTWFSRRDLRPQIEKKIIFLHTKLL